MATKRKLVHLVGAVGPNLALRPVLIGYPAPFSTQIRVQEGYPISVSSTKLGGSGRVLLAGMSEIGYVMAIMALVWHWS